MVETGVMVAAVAARVSRGTVGGRVAAALMTLRSLVRSGRPATSRPALPDRPAQHHDIDERQVVRLDGLDVEDDCEPRRDVADVMQEFERRERPVASCVGKVQAGTASAKPPCTNVEAALTAAGATIHDVVRWTIAVVDGQPLQEGFRAFAQRWGGAADPPAISVYVVAGLAHPRFLIEIDAIAVV